MFRRMSFVALAVLVVTGCATREKYEQRVQSWVGHTSDDLARAWGPPSGNYKLNNGNTMIMYEANSVEAYTSPTQVYQAPGTVIGNVFYPGPTTVTGGTTTTVQKRCRTQFEVDGAGRIVGTGFEGNACKAK